VSAAVRQTELLETFANAPDRFTLAILARADRPTEDGEWGQCEIVRHLIAVERAVWQVRFAEVATNDDPQWSWTEPGLAPGFDGSPIGDIVAEFARVRAETVAIVDAMDDAGWARSGTHATYGVLDVAGLLRIAIDHDAEHLRGIAPQD
jgi:hypothetical protein